MKAGTQATEPVATRLGGTRGPHDDFFCHKYEVWYRVDDCVYRGRNQTFPGCVSCFQGHLNRRCVEMGSAPPEVLSRDRAASAVRSGPAEVIPLRRNR